MRPAIYPAAMDGNTNWVGEAIMMVNADRQRAFSDSISARTIVLAAGLLILLGIVLQLGVLGYGHINASNLWSFSLITDGLWNLFAMHGGGSALGQIAQYWPLALVSVGLGILMLRLERP
jgi:hypothetical protein